MGSTDDTDGGAPLAPEDRRFLDGLAAALRTLSDPEAIEAEACKRLAERLDADRVYYVTIDEASGVSLVRRDHVVRGGTLAGRHKVSDFQWSMPLLRAGRPYGVEDSRTSDALPDADRAACTALDIIGLAVAPVLKQGALLGALCATTAAPRAWPEAELALVGRTADLIWSALMRSEAEARRARTEAVLHGVAEGTTDLIAAIDFDYRVLFCNSAYSAEYARLWGAPIGQGDHLLEGIHSWPEERRKAKDIWDRALGGETFNTVMEFGPDPATARYYDLRFSPVHDTAGNQIGAAHIFRDVTEERRIAARQEVLVDELQHRTRNLLGVVLSVARRTRANSTDLDDFEHRFMARLHALGRATGLLSRLDAGRRVSFDSLLLTELEAHGLHEGEVRSQITLDGPEGVTLASSRLQTFALVLHELMTNALKHGALTGPDGSLAIVWRVEEAGEKRRLSVEWTERWTEPRPAAGEDGFGRELIERALPAQMGAETVFELGADGLRCVVSAPVSRGWEEG
ncbi:MAG: HWE histidine kinase domain-containing protein [Oceanicaulis sp.]